MLIHQLDLYYISTNQHKPTLTNMALMLVYAGVFSSV